LSAPKLCGVARRAIPFPIDFEITESSNKSVKKQGISKLLKAVIADVVLYTSCYTHEQNSNNTLLVETVYIFERLGYTAVCTNFSRFVVGDLENIVLDQASLPQLPYPCTLVVLLNS